MGHGASDLFNAAIVSNPLPAITRRVRDISPPTRSGVGREKIRSRIQVSVI